MARPDLDPEPTLRLHGWRSPPVVGVAVLVMAAGFGQFGAVAALADVAEGLGERGPGDTIAEQAGLSGTALGVGLAVIRLSSLLSLPLAGLADRLGRRTTVLWYCTLGLLATAAAATSPTYWWFVAIFAVSRPFLTACDTVGAVAAAEQVSSSDRAKAVALIAAAYGVGAGAIAVVRGLAGGVLGFRGVFALALVALWLVPVAARRVSEPDRFRVGSEVADKPLPVLGAVGRAYRGRLLVLVAVTFAVATITGPANSFIFLYSENVLGLSPTATMGMVLGAAPTGLAGLLAGRWASDRLGRRPTAAGGLLLLALTGLVTYSGTVPAVVGGYLAAVAGGSIFAPAAGALAAELFPTEVRAAVAGWMVAAGVLGAVAGLAAFGSLADAGDDFSRAALLVFLPAAVVGGLLVTVPETRGRELEDWQSG